MTLMYFMLTQMMILRLTVRIFTSLQVLIDSIQRDAECF